MILLTDLEQATEGSRLLSDKVLLAAGWSINHGNAKFFDLSDTEKDSGCWYAPGAVTDWINGFQRPDPTRNLQDALLLVPEQFDAYVTRLREGKGKAHISKDLTTPPGFMVEVYANPALALCIACLRAMEAA